MNQDKCEILNCRQTYDLLYYKHKVCDKHWTMHCDNKINLKQKFGVEQ